ncbi:MAG TPA: tetratricopeptide repeat protein [Thermoanaerobaculia bacterium]|jgi:tetratricopeptide (TPR) repeat protein|nr:tetratricopeptide repeat protein [Thermoanaerobaculia bacterium]
MRRAFVVFALAAMSLTVAAQIGRSGLVGTAVDEAGQPVADIEITLAPVGETAGRAQVVKTDKRGRFANRFLTSGQYVIDVKDQSKYFIKSANVQIKDAGGVLLKQYDMTNHPKQGMTPLPVQGGQITELQLVVTSAALRQKLIRQLEGGAVSGEVSELVSLLNAGKLDEALALGQQLMQKTSTEIPELIHLVGLTYSRLGKYAEAEPLLRRAAELAPDQVEIAASLGTMLLESARRKQRAQEDAKSAFAEAEIWLGKAVAGTQPTGTALLTNYSIALEGAGNSATALEIMERISKADPNNIAVRLRMAALLRRNGQADKALQVLNSLPGGGDPRAVDSLYNIALDFYNAEDYESALAALKRAEELKPDHALVQRLLGRVYYVAGDYRTTIRHLRKFLELEPNHPEASMDRELVAYLEKSVKK